MKFRNVLFARYPNDIGMPYNLNPEQAFFNTLLHIIKSKLDDKESYTLKERNIWYLIPQLKHISELNPE